MPGPYSYSESQSEICVGIEWNLSGNYTTAIFYIINNLTQDKLFHLQENIKVKLEHDWL